MRLPKSVITYDRDQGTWTKYEAVSDAARILQLPGPSIKNNTDKGTYYKDRYLFLSHEDMIESIDLDSIQIKEVGRLEVQPQDSIESIRVRPVQVYDARTGKWTIYKNPKQAAKEIGIGSITVINHLNTNAFYSEQYLFFDMKTDVETLTLPETDTFIIPTNKKEEEALRKRLGLYPFGKWEQMKTLEDWDALMLKIAEEIDEFNMSSYSKKVESYGGSLSGRAIVQLDLDGNFIREYSSAKEAIKENPKAYNLRSACKGDISHCAGYIWKYKDDYLKEKEDELELQTQNW